MLTFDELKARKDIVNRIDWEITPQEAFEAYQIKSIDAWKHRSLRPVYYFLISMWQGEAKVMLIKKDYKDTEDIAEVPVPESLVAACLAGHGGGIQHGQFAIDAAIRRWLVENLKKPAG